MSQLLVAGELLVQRSPCDPKLLCRRLFVPADAECGQDQRSLCVSQRGADGQTKLIRCCIGGQQRRDGRAVERTGGPQQRSQQDVG